jgi:rubrerythrin
MILLTIGIDTWIQRYTQRTIRINKSLGSVCSICGNIEKVVRHHINKLSNLNKSKMTTYQQLYSVINQKQILVCNNCHIKIHNGKFNLNIKF